MKIIPHKLVEVQKDIFSKQYKNCSSLYFIRSDFEAR